MYSYVSHSTFYTNVNTQSKSFGFLEKKCELGETRDHIGINHVHCRMLFFLNQIDLYTIHFTRIIELLRCFRLSIY